MRRVTHIRISSRERLELTISAAVLWTCPLGIRLVGMASAITGPMMWQVVGRERLLSDEKLLELGMELVCREGQKSRVGQAN